MRQPAALKKLSLGWLVILGALTAAGSAFAEGRGVLGLQMSYAVDSSGKGRIEVLGVDAGGAAEKSGLQPGDSIVQIGGKRLDFASSLELYQANLFQAGTRVALGIEREGKQLELEVVPNRAEEQVRKVESFVAELERCQGDVACATGCSESKTVKKTTRADSAFVKTLETHADGLRLSLRPGGSRNEPELLMADRKLEYRGDFFLEDLVSELRPLLAKAERIDFELRRGPAGIAMKIVHPDPVRLQEGFQP